MEAATHPVEASCTQSQPVRTPCVVVLDVAVCVLVERVLVRLAVEDMVVESGQDATGGQQ